MKVDLKKELDCYRAERDEPRLLVVPDLQYLMIDGSGDPNSPAFVEAITTIYPVAYALKFASKNDLGRDYVVMPLAGKHHEIYLSDFRRVEPARCRTILRQPVVPT